MEVNPTSDQYNKNYIPPLGNKVLVHPKEGKEIVSYLILIRLNFSTTQYSICILVSLGCCNKLPQTCFHKSTKVYSHHPEVQKPKTKSQHKPCSK